MIFDWTGKFPIENQCKVFKNKFKGFGHINADKAFLLIILFISAIRGLNKLKNFYFWYPYHKMEYSPGLHILAEFNSNRHELLYSSANCRGLFNKLISSFGLSCVGEVYHDFDNGGFTAVVCLTESHLSIHTWPEFELATFDIFLSNYQKDNTDKVRDIYKEVLAFFEGTEKQKTELRR